MSEYVILCKIGKRMCPESVYNNNEFIEVHNKLWSVYEVYINYIKEIITIYEQLSALQILDYIEINDELIMIYTNPKRIKIKENDLLEKLFTLIFINYPMQKQRTIKEGIEIQTESSNNKMQKTHITTKLFEALHYRHNVISATQQLQQNNHKELNLPKRFLPKLCKYQQETLLWLLNREREQLEQFPNFYVKLKGHDMETYIYKHLYKWELSNTQPSDIILSPGGILAEEMGLGKTVEMLALILLNPRQCLSIYPNKRQQQSLQQDYPYAKRKYLNVQLLCICKATSIGATTTVTENCEKLIECNKCHLWQHRKCVLNNGHNGDSIENYYCPDCWKILTTQFGYLQIKATFIVSPNIIKIQWLEEIQRHIQPTLKILLYPGVGCNKWISPAQLSTYDIVLTDYTILRREIYYAPTNNSDRCTRIKPRSMRPPCPLLMVQWWRVCLDEAQMIENAKNANAMVRMLPAVNRWAITGTPMQRSLDDLKNLLEFIGFDEITDSLTWHYLVNDFVISYEHMTKCDGNISTSLPLINMLQKCMRRTSKNDVMNELNVPAQLEIVHRIDFSNLEKLFYNEQHNECVENFQKNVTKYQCRDIPMSTQIMKIILQPFLKIRQSCTRPVILIGGGNGINQNKAECSGGGCGSGGLAHEKYFQKPQDLHKYLKGQNELSCKTELRSIVSAHNGLAALYFLKNEYDEALKQYETVLKLAKDYKDLNVSVDSLLQMHALHNIMQILIIRHNDTCESKVLNELLEAYETEYNTLEWKYLCPYANTLSNVNAAYQQILQKYKGEIVKKYLPVLSKYLMELSAKDGLQLLHKIHEDYKLRVGNFGITKLNAIQSSHSIIYILKLWFTKVTDVCHHIMDEFVKLKYFSDNIKARNEVSPLIWRQIMHLIQEVVDCHLSEIHENNNANAHIITLSKKTKTTTKEKCKMCYIRNAINNFECLLYDKSLDESTNLTKGFDNSSFEILLNKYTFTYLKSKYPDPSIQHEMDNIIQYFDNLTLLYKRVSKLWIEMEYTIKAYDELNMCKMRLQLIDDGNGEKTAASRKKTNFQIYRHDIDELMQQQQHTILNAQHMFTRKLARLKYIRHLESSATDSPTKCPICHSTEDERYAVLECGHYVCYLCFKNIRSSLKGIYFNCSVCRNQQKFENVYFASRSSDETLENDIYIKGHYSSKIAFILRLILRLKQQQAEIERGETAANKQPVKILIFSQWQSILQSIADALRNNCINFRIKCTPNTIKEFKDPQLNITCLLMPFIKGSKGLNLVEATHVFLVEPILNPAEELQAIGRVHRFGQIRTTTVHRFIVNGTVEENIIYFLAAKKHANNNIETLKTESAASTQINWEFTNVSLEDFEKMFTLKCDNDLNNYN